MMYPLVEDCKEYLCEVTLTNKFDTVCILVPDYLMLCKLKLLYMIFQSVFKSESSKGIKKGNGRGPIWFHEY